MNRALLFFCVLFVVLPAQGIINESVEWDQVSLLATADGERVAISIRIERQALISMVLTAHGKKISVPKSELLGLPSNLALRTVRIVSLDTKRPPGPTIRIEIDCLPNGQGHDPAAIAQFFFSGLTYTGWKVDFMNDQKAVRSETKFLGKAISRQP